MTAKQTYLVDDMRSAMYREAVPSLNVRYLYTIYLFVSINVKEPIYGQVMEDCLHGTKAGN